MKTILIAAFAVFFAMPANGQYRKLSAYQQWVRATGAYLHWMDERAAYAEIIARFIREGKMPPMTYGQRMALAEQYVTDEFGPCPVIPPKPRALPNPNYSSTDAILDAIDRNTEALESLRDR